MKPTIKRQHALITDIVTATTAAVEANGWPPRTAPLVLINAAWVLANGCAEYGTTSAERAASFEKVIAALRDVNTLATVSRLLEDACSPTK